jgi:hypothetical protein
MVQSAWVKGCKPLEFESENIARGELIIDGGEVLILRAEQHITQEILQSWVQQYAEAQAAKRTRRVAEVVPIKKRRRKH